MNPDDCPPTCMRCGVTMVPAALSADDKQEGAGSALIVRNWTRLRRDVEAQHHPALVVGLAVHSPSVP
jgi:hypothetical protein